MENADQKIQSLTEKIALLTQRHDDLGHELEQVRQQLKALAPHQALPEATPSTPAPMPQPLPTETAATAPTPPIAPTPPVVKSKAGKTPLEEFIGTNLLNKIGIAILVIGIGFGVKYAIDHELLNATARVLLGYLAGLILIGIALKLKTKYTGFSAVLLSGGMAVCYLMTFVAYDFYQLLPKAVAFGLMILFTATTVTAAIWYNLQVIAIIGLTGAYAVPVLLSDGSGKVAILFTYMSIINTGVLTLSFKKNWRLLYQIAFILSWLIFLGWFTFKYEPEEHVWIALPFATIFFVIFHITFLAYKMARKESLQQSDIIFSLLNAFSLYITGYIAIEKMPQGEQFLGLFTIATALLHGISAFFIFRHKDTPKDTRYFVAGMSLVFLTIAIPVQLDGQWVTFLWFAEAGLLYWIGRTKQFVQYEEVAYTMMCIAFFSLTEDWTLFYQPYPPEAQHISFLLNTQFLTTMWSALILGAMLWMNYTTRKAGTTEPTKGFARIAPYVISALLFFTVYVGIYLEINVLWDQLKIPYNADDHTSVALHANILNFKTITLIAYSALFGTMVMLLNRKVFQASTLEKAGLIFNTIVILCFLTGGLLALNDLRTSFLSESLPHPAGYWHILARYICLVCIAPILWFNYQTCQSEAFNKTFHRPERLFFHLTILLILSSELMQWLDLGYIENSYKLALSILWGSYALFLIVFGMTKRQKYLRITGIALFAVTLVKLFFYDLSAMSAIGKTLVMIILGILLLTTSYLYNRYKDKLMND